MKLKIEHCSPFVKGGAVVKICFVWILTTVFSILREDGLCFIGNTAELLRAALWKTLLKTGLAPIIYGTKKFSRNEQTDGVIAEVLMNKALEGFIISESIERISKQIESIYPYWNALGK